MRTVPLSPNLKLAPRKYSTNPGRSVDPVSGSHRTACPSLPAMDVNVPHSCAVRPGSTLSVCVPPECGDISNDSATVAYASSRDFMVLTPFRWCSSPAFRKVLLLDLPCSRRWIDAIAGPSVNGFPSAVTRSVPSRQLARHVPLHYSSFMNLVSEKFEPPNWLKNAHAMTIVSAFWPRRFDLPPPEERLFQVDPESRLLAHGHWQQGKRKDVPVIVIVHGLEGSRASNY